MWAESLLYAVNTKWGDQKAVGLARTAQAPSV